MVSPASAFAIAALIVAMIGCGVPAGATRRELRQPGLCGSRHVRQVWQPRRTSHHEPEDLPTLDRRRNGAGGIADAVDVPADGVVQRRPATAIADQRDVDFRRLHEAAADQVVGRADAGMPEPDRARIFPRVLNEGRHRLDRKVLLDRDYRSGARDEPDRIK